MAKVIYTARATVDGGRVDGHGVTEDGALDVQLRAPGAGGGTNPEQLFAIGYAACFEGALGAAARRLKAETGRVSIASAVSLIPNETRGYELAVALDVTLPEIEDEARAIALVASAHDICPYSNATRGNIQVTLTANGAAVALDPADATTV